MERPICWLHVTMPEFSAISRAAEEASRGSTFDESRFAAAVRVIVGDDVMEAFRQCDVRLHCVPVDQVGPMGPGRIHDMPSTLQVYKMPHQPSWPDGNAPDSIDKVVGGFVDGAGVSHPVPIGRWCRVDCIKTNDGWRWAATPHEAA